MKENHSFLINQIARRLCSAPRNRAIFNIDICPLKLLFSRIFCKAGLSPSKIKKKNICFNVGLSKMMKKVFYFIVKALFVLKILKLLSSFFGHVEKTALLER